MVEIPSQNRTNLRASSIKRRQHISKRIAQSFLNPERLSPSALQRPGAAFNACEIASRADERQTPSDEGSTRPAYVS